MEFSDLAIDIIMELVVRCIDAVDVIKTVFAIIELLLLKHELLVINLLLIILVASKIAQHSLFLHLFLWVMHWDDQHSLHWVLKGHYYTKKGWFEIIFMEKY